MEAAGEHGQGSERTPAASQKSPDAFRTISEVSTDLDVPQHVLRFWEGKFAQIRPMKRGGGRRYYRPEDVDLLRGIQHLLYGDGYTIKGVQKLLRENGVKFVVTAGRREAPAKTNPAPKAAQPAAPVVSPAPPAPTPPEAPKPASSELGGAPDFKPPHSSKPQELPEPERKATPVLEPQIVAPETKAEIAKPQEKPAAEAPQPRAAAPVSASAPQAPKTVSLFDFADAVNAHQEVDEEPEVDTVEEAPARSLEAATKLLAQLKALRRDYDIRLQAAKNGR